MILIRSCTNSHFGEGLLRAVLFFVGLYPHSKYYALNDRSPEPRKVTRPYYSAECADLRKLARCSHYVSGDYEALYSCFTVQFHAINALELRGRVEILLSVQLCSRTKRTQCELREPAY